MPNSATPFLHIENLKLYQADRLLIDGLSLEVSRGERWGILGPNGCGKSTLLASLCGIHTAYDGLIELSGQNIRHQSPADMAQARSWMPQHTQDVFTLRFRDLLKLLVF